MSWKRLAVLVAAALRTTCSSVTVQGGDTAPGAAAGQSASKPGGGITAAIDRLGVCGQVHQADSGMTREHFSGEVGAG